MIVTFFKFLKTNIIRLLVDYESQNVTMSK